MAVYKVEICGVNTSKLPLLTNEEKEELFKKIKNGDEKARETYIKGNLRLVLSVIQRFSSSNENVDDLFQIGCIGLIKAIDNFDVNQNVKFSTYAVPMIMGEVRRYLRDNTSSIRVSRSLRDTAYKAIYAREGLTRKNSKEPTIMEIANEIAPEHLEVCVEDPFGVLNEIKNAGSIFLGRNVPEALGDYFAGPNHTLPTSGTARFSSPLGVDDFVKRSSFLYYTREALGEVAPRIADFAEREGLHAHAKSVTIRYEK